VRSWEVRIRPPVAVWNPQRGGLLIRGGFSSTKVGAGFARTVPEVCPNSSVRVEFSKASATAGTCYNQRAEPMLSTSTRR
jgi:hypothetical protein